MGAATQSQRARGECEGLLLQTCWLQKKTSDAPTMLEDSSFSGRCSCSFSGQCSCSLLEITGLVLLPAWQRRVPDYGCWEITQPLFPPSAHLPERPAPRPHACWRCVGWLCHFPLAAWGPGWPGKMLRWGTSAAWVTLTLPCSPRLAQLTPNALGTFLMSTGLSGTIGFQEILPSLSSLCQHELLEALSTPKEHLILRWIKPY